MSDRKHVTWGPEEANRVGKVDLQKLVDEQEWYLPCAQVEGRPCCTKEDIGVLLNQAAADGQVPGYVAWTYILHGLMSLGFITQAMDSELDAEAIKANIAKALETLKEGFSEGLSPRM